MMRNNDLERMWKEAVLLKILFQHFPEVTEEKRKELQDNRSRGRDGTRNFSITKQSTAAFGF
jgi:hypothetical protein